MGFLHSPIMLNKMKPRHIFFILLSLLSIGAFAWIELSDSAKQKTIKLRTTNFDNSDKSEYKDVKIPAISDVLEMGEEGLKTSQAKSLISFIESAKTHGLVANDISQIKSTLDEGKRLDDAQKQALKDAAIKLAKDFNGGRMNWQKARNDWDMRPKTDNIATDLDQAITIDAIDAWAQNIIPKHDAYLALLGARQQYAQIANNGGFITINNVGTLKLGQTNEIIGKLRNRLAQENYNTIAPQDPNYFDEGLKSKLTLYQKMHGLKQSGELNENTIKALNVSAKDRLAQIDLNLERERWLPRNNPQTRIEANIPTQYLTYYENSAPKLNMNVIVGKVSTKTPILASEVHRIIFNPPWYKPASIKGRQRVQPPGPRNSLGRVKFDFDNRHSVYLHDTPNHYLFSVANRTLSHGCVRLDEPKKLASILVGSQGYDMPKIEEITSTVKTQAVKLNNRVPVLILYRTAFVDNSQGEGNLVHFAQDVYNWDPVLANLLDGNPNNDEILDKQMAQQKVNVAAP